MWKITSVYGPGVHVLGEQALEFDDEGVATTDDEGVAETARAFPSAFLVEGAEAATATKVPPDEAPATEHALRAMTLIQLRELLTEQGKDVPARATKDELIARILDPQE